MEAYRSEVSNDFFQELVGRELRDINRYAAVQNRTPLQKLTDIGDVGSQFTPGVSDARDVYELATGRDLVTQVKLTPFQYTLTAVGTALPIVAGAFFRNALGSCDSS